MPTELDTVPTSPSLPSAGERPFPARFDALLDLSASGAGRRRPLVRYGFAVAIVVVAAAIRLPLQGLLGGSVPFLLFFPAVLTTAWFGGLGPGLLATALSGLVTQVLLMPPLLSFDLSSGDALRLSLFLLIGSVMSLLVEALHRSRRRVERQALERARLLARAEEARHEAEIANRAKDEFLATLSHELRTPLNAVLGWAQLLRLGSDGIDVGRGLETIERNARAQKQLIDDLLDVSRIVSGKMRLDVRPVDLVPVVEAALEAIRPAVEAKGIRLTRAYDALPPVAGDPDRLQQVIWNLLANAVKFTPQGGSVQVTLCRVGSQAEIAVRDDGIGIPPDFLPYVFERFRQLDASRTRRYSGLGLGLAIVRHLVELHGGRVRAFSEGEGHGATFFISLPLSPS